MLSNQIQRQCLMELKIKGNETNRACSIQTWALEEARRRLEKEGILEDPDDVKKP